MRGEHYLWPSDLPEGCPPPGAAERDGLVYRFVKADPLTATDFERPIDKPRKVEPTSETMCELCALSVFTDADDLPIARKFIPGFKKKLVAAAELAAGHGVLEQDSTECQGSPLMESHHNWWVPEGLDPLPLFAVVAL